MANLYDTSLLPSQHAINSVAALSDDFYTNNIESKDLLASLKLAITESGFMKSQDHKDWFSARGADYAYNPNLFASAPLNITCAFLSEMFKRYDIEYIIEELSMTPIKRALLRLNVFKVIH